MSERHDLPLVSFSITFLGGSSQFEPATRKGLAAITADPRFERLEAEGRQAHEAGFTQAAEITRKLGVKRRGASRR